MPFAGLSFFHFYLLHRIGIYTTVGWETSMPDMLLKVTLYLHLAMIMNWWHLG